MNIALAIPNNDDFKSEMVSTLMGMCYYLGMKGHTMIPLTPQGCYIDDNRNICFHQAKTLVADYLFYLDTDVQYLGEGDILDYLINTGKDVVTGIYYQGSVPHRPNIYEFNLEGLIENYIDIPQEPFQAGCSGGGFLLISKKVLDLFTPEVQKVYGKPFDFLFDYDKNTVKLREDVAFFWRMKQLGIPVWAYPEVALGHIKKNSVTATHWQAVKPFLRDGGNI